MNKLVKRYVLSFLNMLHILCVGTILSTLLGLLVQYIPELSNVISPTVIIAMGYIITIIISASINNSSHFVQIIQYGYPRYHMCILYVVKLGFNLISTIILTLVIKGFGHIFNIEVINAFSVFDQWYEGGHNFIPFILSLSFTYVISSFVSIQMFESKEDWGFFILAWSIILVILFFVFTDVKIHTLLILIITIGFNIMHFRQIQNAQFK